MGNKILVTGGDGFIGRNLVSYLNQLEPDLEIDIVDKKSGTDCMDITDISEYTSVIHLAALASIGECMKDMDMAIRDNILISFKLFQARNPHRIPIVFASSQAAKTPEANFYASCKRIVELEGKRINDTEFADIRSLRFTNVYGGIDYLKDKTTVVQKFITTANKKEIPVVNGNGTQTRDFIHVNDICKAIHLTMTSNRVLEEPIDIGTGIETSVVKLMDMMKTDFTFD